MLVCVHHLDPPVLGHARAPLAATGPGLTEVAPYDGDALPDAAKARGIVVLGGRPSVLGLAGDPVLTAEAAWLRAAVDDGVPVLGVCLGAQLLAHVLGGRVFRLPHRRLDWQPLALTPAGRADPVLGGVPPGAHALHWNEDGFTLPPGATALAAPGPGGGCTAFRAGPAAWGLQFHPEVGAPALDGWYASWPAALAEAGVTEDAARAADRRHLGGQAVLSEAIFAAFVAESGRRGSPAERQPPAGTTS